MSEKYQTSKLTSRWIKQVLGFSIGVALGLSPFLGLYDIPIFKPLLSLIPFSEQGSLIPLSSALMGVVAISIQWYAEESFTLKYLNKLFRRLLALCVLTFIVLAIIHTIFVVTVPIKNNEESVSVLVGYSRPTTEPCSIEVSDMACIELISLDPAEISSFWGDRQLRIAKLLLYLSYLAFTSLFGGIAGLLVLRESMIQRTDRTMKAKINDTEFKKARISDD